MRFIVLRFVFSSRVEPAWDYPGQLVRASPGFSSFVPQSAALGIEN